MKISELRKKLDEAESVYGDIDVFVDDAGGYALLPAKELLLYAAGPHLTLMP